MVQILRIGRSWICPTGSPDPMRGIELDLSVLDSSGILSRRSASASLDLLVVEDELHGWDGCLLVKNEDQSVAGSLHEGGFQV